MATRDAPIETRPFWTYTRVINICLGLLVLNALVATAVNAQTTRRDAGAGVAAQVQAAVQQLTAERDRLQRENDELQKRLDDAISQEKKFKKEIAATKNKSESAQTTLAKYQETDAKLREYIEKQNDKIQQIVDKYKELVQNLRVVEAEKSDLDAALKAKNGDYDRCAEKNAELFAIGLDVIDLYENKGMWDSLWQKEPVTKLKKVEMENLVSEYKHKLSGQVETNMSAAAE